MGGTCPGVMRCYVRWKNPRRAAPVWPTRAGLFFDMRIKICITTYKNKATPIEINVTAIQNQWKLYYKWMKNLWTCNANLWGTMNHGERGMRFGPYGNFLKGGHGFCDLCKAVSMDFAISARLSASICIGFALLCEWLLHCFLEGCVQSWNDLCASYARAMRATLWKTLGQTEPNVLMAPGCFRYQSKETLLTNISAPQCKTYWNNDFSIAAGITFVIPAWLQAWILPFSAWLLAWILSFVHGCRHGFCDLRMAARIEFVICKHGFCNLCMAVGVDIVISAWL